MDFEEMQVIWDSQENRQLYAIDAAALHELVRRRGRKQGCATTWEEYGMIAICLFVVVSLAAEPLFQGTDRHQYISAALFAGVAVLMGLQRRRRLQREKSFDDSLAGDLNRAIFRVETRIQLARTFVWWFIAPAGVVVLLASYFNSGSKSLDDWALVLGSFLLGYAVVELALRCSLLPAAQELHVLRDKLVERP